MEIKYKIIYSDEVAKKHIPSLPTLVKEMIKKAIDERLTNNPSQLGKPLHYKLKGYWRLRVSNYRIVYHIKDADKTVSIIAIKHRKDIYKIG